MRSIEPDFAREVVCYVTRVPGRLFWLCAVVLISSCATYRYVARGPAPDFNELPADEQNPKTQRVWSYAWGQAAFAWSPKECDGKGAARVETKIPWYGIPLAVLDLGLAVPSDMTIWCPAGLSQ
jgi:hypothetical protein